MIRGLVPGGQFTYTAPDTTTVESFLNKAAEAYLALEDAQKNKLK